jgi:signal transduction histidine kinase
MLVMGVSVLQTLLVLLVFDSPLATEHHLVTTLCAGVAVFAVVATGWRPRLFALWCAPLGAALVLGWARQSHALGVGMALMSVSLLVILWSQVRDQNRALHRMVALALDNERLAASLRIERDRAQAASESKTRFFAAASHDLRQPLHALGINAFALGMLARQQGEPRIVNLSDSIERALNQSTGLLDGLLDVSRLDAGAVQPQWRDIDLVPLLSTLGQEFAPLAQRGGLQLVVQLPPTPLVVRSDPDLLRRVLTNLLGNALKFTRQGQVLLQARALDARQALLVVQDTGIGISPTDQGRVFDEFYQADNPSRDRSQGLGLGLSIVHRIVALLGIGLQLQSQTGEGTRFELRLPLGQPQQAMPVVAPAPATAPVAAPNIPLNLRVLVIDDEPDIRESMRSLLQQLGCQAATAEDQASALDMVRGGFEPQAIVADHRLRHGTGLAVLAALQAELGPVPSLVITGDTAPDTLQAVLGSGFRVLHKPVDGATLAAALHEVAGGQ